MVTDYDSWREGEAVDVAQVIAVMAANARLAQDTVARFAATLPPVREPSPIDRTLDSAIVTAPAVRDASLMARLDAVAGRVLRQVA